MSGLTEVTLKYAPVDLAATGVLVAAVADRRIVVCNYVLVAAGAVDVKFTTAVTTDLTGAMSIVALGGISASGEVTAPWFETGQNEALGLDLSAAIQVSGHIAYYEG